MDFAEVISRKDRKGRSTLSLFHAKTAEGDTRKDRKVGQTETTQRKDSILCVYIPLRSLREITRLREIIRVREIIRL